MLQKPKTLSPGLISVLKSSQRDLQIESERSSRYTGRLEVLTKEIAERMGVTPPEVTAARYNNAHVFRKDDGKALVHFTHDLGDIDASKPALESLIAHEIIHIKNNDVKKRRLLERGLQYTRYVINDMAFSMGTTLSLITANNTSNFVIKEAATLLAAVGTNSILKEVGSLIRNKVYRRQEYRADVGSIDAMGVNRFIMRFASHKNDALLIINGIIERYENRTVLSTFDKIKKIAATVAGDIKSKEEAFSTDIKTATKLSSIAVLMAPVRKAYSKMMNKYRQLHMRHPTEEQRIYNVLKYADKNRIYK